MDGEWIDLPKLPKSWICTWCATKLLPGAKWKLPATLFTRRCPKACQAYGFRHYYTRWLCVHALSYIMASATTPAYSCRNHNTDLASLFLGQALLLRLALALLHLLHIVQSPAFLSIRRLDFITGVAALASSTLGSVATHTLVLLFFLGYRRIGYHLLQIDGFAEELDLEQEYRRFKTGRLCMRIWST